MCSLITILKFEQIAVLDELYDHDEITNKSMS